MGLVVLAVQLPASRGWFLDNQFLRFCGAISYSVYLYHAGVQAVFFLLLARLRPWLGTVGPYLEFGWLPGLVSLPAVLAVGWVMYRLVERPSLVVCDRLRDPR